jgi:hypothetical protein
MAFVVAVLVVAAALTVAALVRPRNRPDPAASAALERGVPTFRVVALGARGAGKTLLLASMYHQMQTPSGRSYFLTAPYDQVILLNQWFTEVADTSKDWPSGTSVADTREFTFAVRTRAPSGALHSVLHLSYLDYAGGLLTDRQAPGATLQTELLDRIGTADALLGIIDGYRVRQCLDGHPEGRMRLQQTLTAMISLMMLAASPITFVLTKWDLLGDIDADEDGRLQIVRKLLMSNPGFRDLVEAHSAHRVVRLVPVSAVGPEFAEIDAHGQVTKLRDGHMYPTNVDAPLCAVVPDVFEQVERAMDRERLRAALADIRGQSRLSPAAALAQLGTYVLGTAGKALGAFGPSAAGFVGEAVTTLFGVDDEGDVHRQLRVERRVDEADRALDEFHVARRKVLREFQSRVDVLEGRLPSSRLSGER